MSQLNVYFTNFRAASQENLLQKLERLVRKAGTLGDIDSNNKYITIKIYFGEPRDLSYPRPNYSKVTVDLTKPWGSEVFLADCNILYVGGRKSASDHLDAVYENGYDLFTTGCHVLITDDLKGINGALVPINGEYIKEAEIGRAIMGADIFISPTHSKERESTGFGGTMKNTGVGCGFRTGKMEVHNADKPYVVTPKRVGCSVYQKNCVCNAITITGHKASIGHDKCIGCSRCIGAHPMDAAGSICDKPNNILNCKIAGYTYVALKGRPHFHISLVVDIPSYCNCHAENDVSIVSNVGMFTPFDPIALDMAYADAVNRQPVTPGSILSEKPHTHRDHFTSTHLNTNWESAISHTVKMGLKNKGYNLITI